MASYILIPLIILVILPSFGIASEIYYLETRESYPSYLRYFEIIIVIIFLIYILLPAGLSTKTYFRIRGLETSIIEFEFLKKIIYVGLPLLIIVMVVFLQSYQPEDPNFSYALFSGLILIVGGTLSRVIINVSKKAFRFYYAKGCLALMSKEADETNKMNYLIMALNSYNKYLKRNLSLQITNIDNIYSKIITYSIDDKTEMIYSICSSFLSNDKLKPIKYISTIFDPQNKEQFLSKESLGSKIKEWGVFLAAIIPVLISVIQFVLKIS